MVTSGSTHYLQDFFKILGILPQLEFYLKADDYSNGKPDPTCFLMAAKKLPVFEDSIVGIQAAGIYYVALQCEKAPVQDVSPADAVAKELTDFTVDMLGLK